MAINKVIYNTENGPETLIDLTSDTVTPETLAEGVTAHDASGNIISGTYSPPFIPSYNCSEDLIAKSIDTDGSIYEGVGYKLGYRLNSSGGETALANSIITGYIPYEQGDIFLVKAKTSIYSLQYQVAYDSNFKQLGILYGTRRAQTMMLFEGDLIQQYDEHSIDWSKIKYVRFSIQDYTNYPFTIHKAI